jgi:hypothetical protein
MESSARGDVSPFDAGKEIEGAGVFPTKVAEVNPSAPANNPLSTPAIIAFFTAGDALAPEIAPAEIAEVNT